MNQIGFGCSKLTSNFTRKQALKNLETAFDAGITHFDVARLYGQGLAESILGEFMRAKRDQVTITTKTGLTANRGLLSKNLFLQNVAKIAYRQVKKLGGQSLATTLTPSAIVNDFAIDKVKTSVETSLRELNTDYVDYLLLHEATVEQANNANLVALLEDYKKNGSIKQYGIASYSDKIRNQLHLLPKGFTVLQTNSSFPTTVPHSLQNEAIDNYFYFSPLLNIKQVGVLFKTDKELAKSVSSLLGFDVAENALDIVLMQQNMNANDGTFLFTTADNSKIKQTMARWRHIQTISVTPVNFEEAKMLINHKLQLSCR